ncbi:MAG: rRNA ((2499)-C(5))-methyltransferase [Deltaproteobacteria bacterium]|nr:rRNA ((2499)-C(5))-methyltransferase [Deltaproteobacteria bacterium]
MTPRRYQLRRDATAIVESGHPWIFRDQLSSAAGVFRDGDWLRLVDGSNRVVGHGLFESEGAIAIRVLRRGPERPDAAWFRGQLAAAQARRESLVPRTDGIRLLHGESDGVPAVVIDRFGETLVVSSYSAGADAIARFLARCLADVAPHCLLRPARRRQGPAVAARVLRGAPPEVATFTEDGLALAVDLSGGQKTGAYLDLRGLRHALATTLLTGARVLNLFAYSGMLGRAAEAAGAAAITQVDASQRALGFAAAHHVVDPSRHHFVTADVFAWLPALDQAELFDVVIVDPPSMTSKQTQVPGVLAAYRKLYRAAALHVRPGGVVIAACCTSRVERGAFHQVVRESLGKPFVMERELPTEPDHPVGFPQADYLKIAWWRRPA